MTDGVLAAIAIHVGPEPPQADWRGVGGQPTVWGPSCGLSPNESLAPYCRSICKIDRMSKLEGPFRLSRSGALQARPLMLILSSRDTRLSHSLLSPETLPSEPVSAVLSKTAASPSPRASSEGGRACVPRASPSASSEARGSSRRHSPVTKQLVLCLRCALRD